MRKTNILTRSGTYALILGALGLTAPVFTATAASPVTEAVDIVTTKAIESLEDNVAVTQTEPSQTEPSQKESLPTELVPQAKVYKDAASDPTPQTVRKAVAQHNGLPPMRLRFVPDFTTEKIANIQAYREKAADGDEEASKELKSYSFDINKNNRMQLTVKNDGSAFLDISNGSGGWPGYPATNTKWEKRPLSVEMKKAMADVMKRCSKASAPVYFIMDIMGGDADLGKGTYEIACVRGSEAVQAGVNDIDLAHAYLASSDIPLERRQNSFQWKLPFALFHNYVKTTANATISGDRAECVRIYTLMKEKYAFTENARQIADYRLNECATSDYNWVRKRENLPLVE